MGKKDPRIDAYIAKSADFAKPILTRIRKLVHEGCPGVVETIKWGSPSFEYHGILCGMAAFKQHCAFGFWNRALKIPDADPGAAMGQFGRLESEADMLSDKVLLGYIREAARLNETGQKLGPMERTKRKTLPVPKELTAALKKKPAALAKFKAFSPSQQRDYSEWIVEAKTDATRDKRLATAVDWIGQGKPRMWKYMKTRKA
jgi:uncharacterized protein YdeI (YjbR/CyaY-like superfamily)